MTRPDWTGQLSFDLCPASAHVSLGAIEILARSNDVAVFYADRSIAVIERPALHAWLHDPRSPFTVDDVTLEAHGQTLSMRLHMSAPIPVPPPITARLKALV